MDRFLLYSSTLAFHIIILLVGRHSVKRSATTIPKSLLLGTGLTWGNLTWIICEKRHHLNKDSMRLCMCMCWLPTDPKIHYLKWPFCVKFCFQARMSSACILWLLETSVGKRIKIHAYYPQQKCSRPHITN